MRAGCWGTLGLCIVLGASCAGLDGDEDGTTGLGTATDTDTDGGEPTSGGGGEGTDSTTTTSTSAPPPVTSASASSPGDESTGTGGSTTTTSTTSTTTTTSSPSGDEGPPPLGPRCSVQVVTQGGQFDPLPRDEAGAFPGPIADILEDYCGCHTLGSNSENIEWEFLAAPGGTLFLDYGDMSRGYQGSTLGEALAEATLGEMPPGSCPRPGDPLAVLTAWFDQGLPDAENYVP